MHLKKAKANQKGSEEMDSYITLSLDSKGEIIRAVLRSEVDGNDTEAIKQTKQLADIINEVKASNNFVNNKEFAQRNRSG